MKLKDIPIEEARKQLRDLASSCLTGPHGGYSKGATDYNNIMERVETILKEETDVMEMQNFIMDEVL